jgi:hypothetical protein
MPTRNFHIINYLYKTLGILVMYTPVTVKKHNLTAGKEGEA